MKTTILTADHIVRHKGTDWPIKLDLSGEWIDLVQLNGTWFYADEMLGSWLVDELEEALHQQEMAA